MKTAFSLTFLFLFLLFFSIAYPDEQEEMIGFVRVGEWDTAPTEAYDLVRGEKSITKLYQDMPVANGDMIVPKPGHQVTLHFFDSKCASVCLDSTFKVLCRNNEESSGLMANILETMQPLERSDEFAVIMRDGEFSETESNHFELAAKSLPKCFWPKAGSTLLADEPIFFSWNKDQKPSRLIVRNMARPESPVIENPLSCDQEWIVVEPGIIEPGATYFWSLLRDSGLVSKEIEIHILSRNASRALLAKAKISQSSADTVRFSSCDLPAADIDPDLWLSAFLLDLFQGNPGFDLRADALRLASRIEYLDQENRKLARAIIKRIQETTAQ